MRSDYTNAARSKLHAVLQHVALYTLWTVLLSLHSNQVYFSLYTHNSLIVFTDIPR